MRDDMFDENFDGMPLYARDYVLTRGSYCF